MPQHQELFFVRLADPVTVRRSLLETNKEILLAMSKYERFKLLRRERHEQTTKLKQLCSEINELMKKLEVELPKPPVGHEIMIPKKFTPIKEAKPKNELDKIEYKLKQIEQRIGKLA